MWPTRRCSSPRRRNRHPARGTKFPPLRARPTDRSCRIRCTIRRRRSLPPRLGIVRLRQFERAKTLEHGHTPLRIFDIPSNLGDESRKGVRTAGIEEPAAVRVGVDVDDRVLFELGQMLFDPFRRSQEALFFGVPGGEDERAARTPSALGQFTDGPRFFHQRDHAADRIARAVNPGIVMIAA